MRQGVHFVLSSLVDSRGVVRVRVEQRDYQYKLVSRADRDALTGGGEEAVLAWGMALYRELVADYLATYTATLGGQNGLNLE